MRGITTIARDFRKFATLCICLAGISACGGGGGSGNGGTGPANIDNSKFYGTYDVTQAVGSCDPERSTITIGDRQNRDREVGYIYLPQHIHVESFSLDGVDVTINISGNEVSITNLGEGWGLNRMLNFVPEQSTMTITGTSTSDDPDVCTGEITGNATRLTPVAAYLYDLAVGKTFRYTVTDLNNGSNSWEATLSVQSKEVIDAVEYFQILITNQSGNNEEKPLTVRSTATELYIYSGGVERLWFSTGNVGYGYVRDPGGDNDGVEITAVGDVSVPYGTVSAYTFSIWAQGAATPYLIQSVTPGIGIVKEVNHEDNTEMVLVSIDNG